jgi:protein SCO1/2
MIATFIAFAALNGAPAATGAGQPGDARASALEAAGWAPPPAARVPLALAFRDEAGRTRRLAALVTGPTVLMLGYHGCANLCGATLDGLAAGLAGVPGQAGRDYQVLAVSVDPRESPADALARKLRYRGRPGAAAWRFLVGDAPTIGQLTRAVGFRFAPDPASRQIAHPAGILVLAPDGRVSSYLGGVAFPPDQLGQALARARAGDAHPSIPQVLLRCFHYDPAAAGAHDGQVLAALRLGGGAIVAGLLALVLLLVRRERVRGGVRP